MLLPVTLTDCSIGMALSGKNTPDLWAMRRAGSTRGEVELQPGPPESLDSQGIRVWVGLEYGFVPHRTVWT
jgi:hypothetical protein